MRISDWSSDVCSSDLPLPLREGYKLGQSARSTGGMEQGHGFFRHRRLQPFGIPRLRRLINIAVDDCERRRIKGASIPAAGMENATITLGSKDFYKRVYVRSTRRRHGKQNGSEP